MSSYAGCPSSIGPWDSVSQVSSRPARSTETITVPRSRRDTHGGSNKSRSGDDRTSRWLTVIPENGYDNGAMTSSKTSSRRSGRDQISGPKSYEGASSDSPRRRVIADTTLGRSSASRDSTRSRQSEKSDSTIRPRHSYYSGLEERNHDDYSAYSKPRKDHGTSSASRAYSRRPTDRDETSERSEASMRRSSHLQSKSQRSSFRSPHDRAPQNDIPGPHHPWKTYHGTKTVVEYRPGHRPVTVKAEEEWYGPVRR